MSPKNHKSFVTALVNDFKRIVFKTCNVDLESARASYPSDRDNIFKAVEATVGFDEVNKVVIGLMEEWMVESGEEALAGLPEEERARLLQDQGKLNKAEPLFRKALEALRRTLGDTHRDTLISINSLGVLLKVGGKLNEAERLLREALEGRRRTFGDMNPDTLRSINNLAMLLRSQQKLNEAEPLYSKALERRRRTLGDTHPDTLTSINNIVLFLHDQGNWNEAERLLREALEAQRRTLGDTHPHTLSSINNLASTCPRKIDFRQFSKVWLEEKNKEIFKKSRLFLFCSFFFSLFFPVSCLLLVAPLPDSRKEWCPGCDLPSRSARYPSACVRCCRTVSMPLSRHPRHPGPHSHFTLRSEQTSPPW